MKKQQQGRVTERGQVTIPKPLRERLGIRPGGTVQFEEAGGGRIILSKAPVRDAVDAAYGIIELDAGSDEFVAGLRGEADPR